MQNAVTIPYHQQDHTNWCGPAVAMMILDAVGQQKPQQRALIGALHDDPKNTATDPRDLKRVLNDDALPEFATFDFVPGSSFNQATSQIALRVAGGAPVAAVVYGTGHWVVVTDVNIDYAQTAGNVLRGFYIHCPSIRTPAGDYVHTPADCCGTTHDCGGLEENQYVSYACWKDLLFKGSADENGDLEFVAIAGSGAARGTIVPPKRTTILNPQKQCDGSIFPALATASASAGMASDKFDQSGALQSAFRCTTWDSPSLIYGLFNLPEAMYYLVPAVRNGLVTGVVRVNALNGDFLGAAAVKDGVINVFLQEDARYDWIPAGKRRLVWAPSLQSRSPFDPFLEVRDHDGNVTYVNSRRETFSHPTALFSSWM
jgi:hypothetical protein